MCDKKLDSISNFFFFDNIMEKKNYKEKFFFPDIDFQPYPVYALSSSGKIVNFRSIIYPNKTSAKKYTRNKQLKHRSKQASMFDMLINIGYWGTLPVVREFPVVINNSYRVPGLTKGLFFMLDYYFPTLLLAVELDSALHSEEPDKIRDEYLLQACGITTFRIRDLELPRTQKTRFHELINLVKSIKPLDKPVQFAFGNDLYAKLSGM